MSVRRLLVYLGTVAACLALSAAALRASLTADFLGWLSALGTALVSNLAVQFVLVGGTVLGLLSLCALSWDKAERRYREHQARLAEAARGEAARRQPYRDTSSLLDDSPGALPETWQAPCGEPIRFPSSATDRGSAA